MKISVGQEEPPLPEQKIDSLLVSTVVLDDHLTTQDAYNDARIRLERVEKASAFMDSTKIARIPLLEHDELLFSKKKLLGSGGFSNVYALSGICCNDNDLYNKTQAAARRKLAGSKNREYAVKCIKSGLIRDCKLLQQSTFDLMLETRFLSNLDHENIIKLRGMAAETRGFFIVMDRLYESMIQRMEVWRRKRQTSKLRRLVQQSVANIPPSFHIERIQAVCELANAFVYLHSKKIVYRDLKKGNLGFGENGRLQLFDFGLAMELTASRRHPFFTTSYVGTHPFMAPEIVKQKPYDLSVDTYSFGIMLWEIMALKEPFQSLFGHEYEEKVVYGGKRPKISLSWSRPIANIMQKCWDADPKKRPTMKDVHMVLEGELEELKVARWG